MLRRASDVQVAGHINSKWRHATRSSTNSELQVVHERLKRTIDKIRADNEVSVQTYHEVMRIVGKRSDGGNRIRYWYDQMIQHGVRPDDTTILLLLHAYALARDIDGLRRVWGSLGPKPDIPLRVHTTYMLGLVMCKEVGEALERLEAMEAEGPEPSMVLYTMLLGEVKGEVRARFVEKIKALNKGQLDTAACVKLMRLACTEVGYGEGVRVLGEMRDAGVLYDARVYGCLLGCAGSSAELLDAWSACKRDGLSPTIELFNTVLCHLSRKARHISDAYHTTTLRIYFEALPHYSLTPTYDTARYALTSCASTADVTNSERIRSRLPPLISERDIIHLVLDSYRRAAGMEEHPEDVPIFPAVDASLVGFRW